MNGKAARALRKELDYHPRNPREYYEIIWKVKRNIAQIDLEDKDAKMKVVQREVEAVTIECISGDRKLYKYLKRKYTNINHEEQLNVLPEQEVLDDIKQQFQEDLRAAKRRGIPGKDEPDHGSEVESREPEAEGELPSSEESRD